MTRTDARLEAFLRESNAIEGIHREPYQHELATSARFLEMETLTLQDLNDVQQAFAPGHVLRDLPGLDVRVGDYIAPRGSVAIKIRLQSILDDRPYRTSPSQRTSPSKCCTPTPTGTAAPGASCGRGICAGLGRIRSRCLSCTRFITRRWRRSREVPSSYRLHAPFHRARELER